MNFDTQTLIVAFPPSEMANLEAYRNLYGADLPTSGNRHSVTVKTLLAHDDFGCPDGLRAGMMPTTVSSTDAHRRQICRCGQVVPCFERRMGKRGCTGRDFDRRTTSILNPAK
jgi:hypothetical protein